MTGMQLEISKKQTAIFDRGLKTLISSLNPESLGQNLAAEIFLQGYVRSHLFLMIQVGLLSQVWILASILFSDLCAQVLVRFSSRY